MLRIIIAIMVILFTIAGCTAVKPVIPLTISEKQNETIAKLESSSSVYYFSFDLRMDPSEDVKMYAPFLKYLEKSTGYQFKIRPMAPDENLIEELGNGRVDIAAIGTLSYLKAYKDYGVRAIARGITEQGRAEYRALIITAPNSKIRSLQDLKGKTFAFGSDTSTQGHLIPRIMLGRAGIKLSNLAGYIYTGSHFETANAVISGRYAAGGIQDKLGRELAGKGMVRILAESEDFPSSTISVSPKVSPDVVQKIQEALLAFRPEGKDKATLYHWEQTEMPLGFAQTDDQAFETVRLWAVRLGLL